MGMLRKNHYTDLARYYQTKRSQQARYRQRTGSNQYRRRQWTEKEDRLVLSRESPDRQLSKSLRRSVSAYPASSLATTS